MNISIQERDRRYRAIRQHMTERGLDSLLIAGRGDHVSRGNIRYVTDFGIITGHQSCVFPIVGDPVLVVIKTPYLPKLRSRGWISSYAVSSNIVGSIIDELSRLDQGNKIGIVGMTDISIPVYKAVEARFPGRLIDATDIFKGLRLIKSKEEIETMKRCASIADKVYEGVKKIVRPGLVDYKIYAEMRRIIHENGCQYSMELISTGEGGIPLFFPTGDLLPENGILCAEITPSYEGYYTQLVMTIPVINYSHRVQEMVSVIKEIFMTVERIVRPGVKISDLSHTIQKMVKDSGYNTLGERMGHGMGLDVIDFWAFAESEHLEVKRDMTFALHPGLMHELSGESVGFGYTYVVTDSGVERLNKADLFDSSR